MRQILSLLLAGCVGSVMSCAAAWAQDTDRDGIPNAAEEQLGTDKDTAESLETVGTYPCSTKRSPSWTSCGLISATLRAIVGSGRFTSPNLPHSQIRC